MYQSIKNAVVVLFLIATLSSCNQGETLQGYYVANQETPNFISVDIPVSFVNVDHIDLTDEQREARHADTHQHRQACMHRRHTGR